jgi:hypothetical protein
MSANDDLFSQDNDAHGGCPAVPCSRLDYERATVCRLAEERGEFVTDVDGFVYWWPSAKPEHDGHLSPHQLRFLADELDRRNAPWQAQINDYFDSENANVDARIPASRDSES